MAIPYQITFRGVGDRAGAGRLVASEIEKLERFFDRVIRCQVMVEAPHRSHETGNVHHVRVRLLVPQDEIVVSRDPPEHHAHEDLQVAIRDAFHAVRRQLEDYVRRDLRHEVKGEPRR